MFNKDRHFEKQNGRHPNFAIGHIQGQHADMCSYRDILTMGSMRRFIHSINIAINI